MEQTLEELEDEGVELLFAENGEIALEIIKDEKPQLFFLDVMMPKMNGFDVCNCVKHELALKGIYIIMLTAKGQEFDRQKVLNLEQICTLLNYSSQTKFLKKPKKCWGYNRILDFGAIEVLLMGNFSNPIC